MLILQSLKLYSWGSRCSAERKQNSDGTKTLTFHAEDVIDFAWTASPRFKIAEAKWKKCKNKSPASTGALLSSR